MTRRLSSSLYLWFAKTRADCKINNIGTAFPPLVCYNSRLCFNSFSCASKRWFASCGRFWYLLYSIIHNIKIHNMSNSLVVYTNPTSSLDGVSRDSLATTRLNSSLP